MSYKPQANQILPINLLLLDLGINIILPLLFLRKAIVRNTPKPKYYRNMAGELMACPFLHRDNIEISIEKGLPCEGSSKA